MTLLRRLWCRVVGHRWEMVENRRGGHYLFFGEHVRQCQRCLYVKPGVVYLKPQTYEISHTKPPEVPSNLGPKTTRPVGGQRNPPDSP